MQKILLALLWIFFVSCECPPNLDTGKELVPAEYSNVCFINLSKTYPIIDVYTGKILILDNLIKTSNAELNYSKFPSGFANILFKNDAETIFNSFFFSKKDELHTYLFYDVETSQFELILNDGVMSDSVSSYFRIIQLSAGRKLTVAVFITADNFYEFTLNSKESTNPIPLDAPSVNIIIIDTETQEELAKINNIALKENTITNLILFGDGENIEISTISSKKKSEM